jgi:hypothetical protein
VNISFSNGKEASISMAHHAGSVNYDGASRGLMRSRFGRFRLAKAGVAGSSL